MHMIYGYGGWSLMIIFMIISLLTLFSIGIFFIRYFVQGLKKSHFENIGKENSHRKR